MQEPTGSTFRHCGGRCARVASIAPSPPPHDAGVTTVCAQRACCAGRMFMRKTPYFGGAFALLLCLSPAYADGSPDTGSAELGDISVTATRTPLIADQEVAPVIVIGPQQLALAQGGDVGSVLRQYAGLDIAQTGGPGQPESLFLRGANSNQTL